ncbi:MAG: GTPase Era [Pseudomonadota bacterium]
MTAPSGTRCGFVAVMGAPNAGKSTLVNHMVGAKVSIVTHKAQTTRTAIRGVALEGASQIVFVDTPGVFAPRRRLDRAMVGAAWAGAEGADVILLLVDAAGKTGGDGTTRILDGLREANRTAVLVLNKIDATPRPRLLALAADLNETGLFSDTFMISAANGDGVADLKAHLAGAVPEGDWLYPEDQVADLPQRLLAAELTREKLFLRLHDELPYAATVETENWTRTKKGELRVEQTIYVERDSQKGIVLGKGGRTIKEIGAAARADLEEQLGERAHLFLFVKVRKDWGDDPARYREMGLDIVD